MTKLKYQISEVKKKLNKEGHHVMDIISTKPVDVKVKCKNCKILERANGSSRCKPCSGLYKLKGKKKK